MTGDDLNTLISATAAAFTALVFLRAAWHKLTNFDSFSGFLSDYRIVPEWSIPAVSRAVVAVELSVVLALISPLWRPLGGCIAMALLLGYAAAMTINITRGRRRLECGCGGAPQLLSWPLVFRNIVLTGAAMLVLLTDTSTLTRTETLAAVISGFTLWLGFVLAEQLLANASRARSIAQDPIW